MNDRATPLETALKILSRKRASSREITTRLKKKGYTDDEIESALKYLEESHYIDDTELIVDYIRLLVEKKYYGPERVVSFLREKGFDTNLVRDTLERQYSEETYLQNARSLIEKKFKGLKLEDIKTRQKIIRSLSYKGYGWDLIERVLNR